MSVLPRCWQLRLECRDSHCLRLLQPRGTTLRCWHDERAYAILGCHAARELLPVNRLLSGKSVHLRHAQVRELLLITTRITLQMELQAKMLAASPVDG